MRHYTLFTLLFCMFLSLLGIGIIIPVLPIYASAMGATGFALGVIIAAFSVSRGILQPFVGNWSDRFGRKRFLVLGLGIYGMAGLLIPQATEVYMLVAIRFFHGIGSAMLQPVVMAYISLLAPAGKEGRYQSYLNAAIFLGIGCGPIIGGLIADHLGMNAVFYSMALFCFFAMVLTLSFIPNHETGDKKEIIPLFAVMKRMWASQKTKGILLVRFVTTLTIVPTMAFLPLLLASWHAGEFSGTAVGLVIACRTLANAVMQFPFGIVADKMNKRLMLTIACCAFAAVMFAIPFCQNYAVLMVLYVMLGSIEALLWALLGAYASLEGKSYGHGTMMGVYGLAMSCGIFTGAIVAGTCTDYFGITVAYKVIAGIVLLASLTGVILIHRGEKTALSANP